MKLKLFVLGLVGFFLSMVGAHAAADNALSGAVTDMTTYWGTVSALVITVVLFGIGIAFAERLNSR